MYSRCNEYIMKLSSWICVKGLCVSPDITCRTNLFANILIFVDTAVLYVRLQ